MIKINPKPPIQFLGGEVVTFVFLVCTVLYFLSGIEGQRSVWIPLTGAFLISLVVVSFLRLHASEKNQQLRQQIITYTKVYAILVGLMFIFYSLYPFSLTTKSIVAATVLVFPVLVAHMNYLLKGVMEKSSSKSENTRYALVAGVGDLAGNVEKHLYSYHKSGFQVKGFIKCNKEECVVEKDRVVGDLEHINDYLSSNTVDEIVIALPTKVSKKVRNIIAAADYHGVRVKYVPDYRNLLGENYKMKRYGHIDAVNVRQLPLDETSAFLLKNSFDKAFSVLALIAFAPLFLLLAILIKLDSPGPIFYCPVRIGKRGRPFRVFKFRTMHENDSSSGGVMSTQKDDPRITKLGKVLRKYSLDELPQFLNVVLGEMSVVGPRPHRSFLNQQLQSSVDKYMIRHYFKPGITGWAQVNGWRGPTATEEQRIQRTLHDLWYMENWSFMLDIKIIYKTVFSKKVHKEAF